MLLYSGTIALHNAAPGFDRSGSAYEANLGASWEIDVFGSLRRGGRAAHAAYKASEAGAVATRLAVAAQTADLYDNSWVLIPGASGGFGEEFARQYAEQGHSLVLLARRLDRLQALAEALRRQYRIEIVAEQVDLSDIAAVTLLHRRLHEQDIATGTLINNAGHFVARNERMTRISGWITCLRSPIRVTQAGTCVLPEISQRETPPLTSRAAPLT